MYGPHVIAVMAGQNIEIKNNDPTNHNIHPLPKVNQEWNESQAPGAAIPRCALSRAKKSIRPSR